MAFDPYRWDRAWLDEQTLWAAPGPKPVGRGLRYAWTAQHPLSAYTAGQVLQAGGSAADAVVAAAGVDTVVQPGTCSLGGTLLALLYEPDGARTTIVNAGYNTPSVDDRAYDHRQERETGHAVLVPGTVAGLETLWQRAGQLPWRDLWRPAEMFARDGFRVRPSYRASLERRRATVLRLASGHTIFAPDGDLPEAGALFRQLLLAETIAHIAADGAASMYRGPWAEQFVATVNAAGGQMCLDDLASYQVRLDAPLSGSYLGHTIHWSPPPYYGGAVVQLALNVVAALGLEHRPQRHLAAEVIVEEVLALQAAASNGKLQLDLRTADAERLAEFERLLTPDFARSIADEVRAGTLQAAPPQRPRGSHGLAAIDTQGRICVAVHSIASDAWGDTGLFVDGVALNSARYMQTPGTPPGARVPSPAAVQLAFDGDVSRFAATAIGAGLWGCLLQNTLSVLGHNVELAASVDADRWGFWEFDRSTLRLGAALAIEPFDSQLLEQVEALGQPLARRARLGRPATGNALPYGDTGYWTAVGVDVATGERQATVDPRTAGVAGGA